MSKDAQRTVALTEDARKKFDECVAALAACGFGAQGPPVETTFAEIEDFGHEVGRMVARAVDERLAAQHAEHFQDEAACPQCQTGCPPEEESASCRLQTTDGDVSLHEPVHHCPACHRDFFPSTPGVEAGRPLLQSAGAGKGDALRGAPSEL